jgi:hypothetical protein
VLFPFFFSDAIFAIDAEAFRVVVGEDGRDDSDGSFAGFVVEKLASFDVEF